MAGNFVKITLHFQAGAYGWTERHYGKDSIAATVNRAKTLMRARNNLLGEGCQLLRAMVSDDELPGASKMVAWDEAGTFQQKPPVAGGGGAFGAPELADVPWTGVKIRAQGQPPGEGRTALYKKTFILSGVPDLFTWNPPMNFEWDVAIEPAFDAFCEVLWSGDWGFKVRDRTSATATNLKVYSYTVTDKVATLQTDPHGLTMPALGDPPLKLWLTGFRTAPAPTLKGNIVVTGLPDPSSITVNFDGPTPDLITHIGTVRSRGYRVVPYWSLKAIGEMTRKRGAGPQRPKGKSRSVKIVG